MRQDVDLWICPECGAEVEVGARGCPRCLEAERRKPAAKPARSRSWQQDEIYDGLDLADDEFNYHDFLAREFGRTPPRPAGIAWHWWVAAIALLIVLAAALLVRLF